MKDNYSYTSHVAQELELTEVGPLALQLDPAAFSQLREITAAWLASHSSAHTRASYTADLALWLGWCDRCGIGPLDARKRHMDMWIAFQREQGPRGDGKPAAKASIGRRVSAVSSWYDYIIVDTAGDPEPLMVRNPGHTKARPKVSPDYSPTLGLSRRQADDLIKAADADGARSGALIRLLLVLGLRCGSAIGAQVTDLGHDRGYRTLELTGKGDEPDRVPIPPSLGAAIDAMLAERGVPAAGPLFAKNGKPLTELQVFRLVRRLARNAGIPQASQLSPHSLRHTAITELLNAGASLRDAQDFARHKDPRTTRRYDRARGSLDRHGAWTLAGRYGVKDDD